VKAVLVISARDNVATALEPLERGRRLSIDGREIVVSESIAAGHKIAIAEIRQGSSVIKYGSAIGTATTDIGSGAHVHTHNVASARGRGDLAASSAKTAEEAGGRLAEPVDEGSPAPAGENSD
jgi:SAF domain